MEKLRRAIFSQIEKELCFFLGFSCLFPTQMSMEEIVLLRHQSNLWLDGFRSRSKLVMIPTGFPMRLLPCLQFRPGCQQVAFTLTLLNTRGLDSSNRDVDHKSDATKLRWLEPSFSGRNWPRTINAILFFRGKPSKISNHMVAVAFRSID